MDPERSPDADALAEHAAFVRAVARAALKGDDAVEDVVQDTYAAALASGPEKPGSLRAWLAGVARRQAAARIRRRAMRRRHAPLLPQPGTDEATLEVAARVETSRQVVDAVMALDEPYRSAILLRYWDDLPPREIAKRKEVPVETARTWVKRGLGQLRARLERDHGPGRDGWKAVLLPLVFVPKSGAALATTAAVGGVLAMKKFAALAIGLLLVAGSALWWNHDDGTVEREDVATQAAPLEDTPLDADVPPDPTLAGRAPEEAVEPGAARTASLPFRGRIVGPDGKPVPGVQVKARVWLCCSAAGMWTVHSAVHDLDDPLLVVTSDAEGRFAFPVTPDGTADDPVHPCAAVEASATVAGYVPSEVRLERDQVAEVRLLRGGTLVVTVVSPEGDPVPGAHVGIQGTSAETRGLLATTAAGNKVFTTGEDGRAKMLLPVGRFRVRAQGGGHAPGTVDAVEVVEGGRTEQLVRLGAGLLLSIRIVGPEDEPVAGAHLRLAGPLSTSTRAISGADGRCQVTHIAPPADPDDYWGSMLFYGVTASGYALRTGYTRLPYDEQTFEVELRLVRGVPVRLHIVDDDAQPLENVQVSVKRASHTHYRVPVSSAIVTDASGWAELPRLAPGTYSVTLTTREGGYVQERFELAVGSQAVRRQIVLERRSGSLAGKVFLPDGSPAADGKVGVVEADAPRSWRLVGGSTDLGPDGTFLLERLQGGRYALVASAPGFVPQWREVDLASGEAREGIEVRLERRGRVRGRVLGWGDVPIQGAEIDLRVDVGRDGAHQLMLVPVTKTDAEGRFEILGLDEVHVTLNVRHEAWEQAWPWPADVHAGTDDAVFVMKPADEGSGMPVIARVLADGRPYDGKLSAAVTDPGGGNLMGTMPPVALGDGRYEVRIHFRAPGPYDLSLTAPGWRPFEVHGVEIRHRPPRPEVTVTLDRGATLELRVVGGDGTPWANRWLQYGMGQIKTDEHGVVALSGLEPGSLERLHVSDPADGRYTYASFESVPVPGRLEVVLRRCGHVRVETPYLYSNVEHDLVFRALDADGNVVDTHVHPVGRYGKLDRTALGYLKIYADGTYRIVLETNGKQVETEAEARVGQAVELTLDPR